MLGCALPWRPGSEPVTSAPWATFTRLASALSIRGTSMWAPSPVRRAAATAVAACRPVSTSTSATPTLWGSPSGGPVIDISPLSAWATKS